MTKQNKKWLWIAGIILVGSGIAYFRSRKNTVPDITDQLPILDPVKTTVSDAFPLKVGSTGPKVLALQKYLNSKLKFVGASTIAEDGSYGPQTAAAVKMVMGGITEVSKTIYNNNILA